MHVSVTASCRKRDNADRRRLTIGRCSSASPSGRARSSSSRRTRRATSRHDYIGTEHLLLGLLREEEGLAARVLESLGVTLEDGAGAGRVDRRRAATWSPTGQIPFTPQAKKRARALAARGARRSATTTSAPSTSCSGSCASKDGRGHADPRSTSTSTPTRVRDEVIRELRRSPRSGHARAARGQIRAAAAARVGVPRRARRERRRALGGVARRGSARTAGS